MIQSHFPSTTKVLNKINIKIEASNITDKKFTSFHGRLGCAYAGLLYPTVGLVAAIYLLAIELINSFKDLFIIKNEIINLRKVTRVIDSVIAIACFPFLILALTIRALAGATIHPRIFLS